MVQVDRVATVHCTLIGGILIAIVNRYISMVDFSLALSDPLSMRECSGPKNTSVSQ